MVVFLNPGVWYMDSIMRLAGPGVASQGSVGAPPPFSGIVMGKTWGWGDAAEAHLLLEFLTPACGHPR